MNTSSREARATLQRILEAHPSLSSVPRRILLPGGRSITVRQDNGHQVIYEDGRHHVDIHDMGGHISLEVIGPEKRIEGVSRPDLPLQGIDRIPGWAQELLTEIANTPSSFNS